MPTAARPRRRKVANPETVGARMPLPAIPGASRAVQRAIEAARRQPESVELRHALADTLRASAFLPEAIDCFRAVITMSPGLGAAHRDLGNVLADRGQLDEAVRELRRAVELTPHEPGALLGLVRTYEKCGTPELALPHVEQLGRDAAAHPRSARHQLHHALALSQVGRLGDAVDGVRAALALADDDAEAWDFLGLLLADRRDWDGARAAYDRALALQPGRGQTLFYRATLRLRLGDYAGGLADYEGRWDNPLFTTPRRDYGVPRWRGEPLAGRVLLLHTEQGLGDTLQFARFIAHARTAGAGRVIVECEDHMARLLAGIDGVDEIVRRGEPLPQIDAHAAVMSMGHLAGATIESVATAAPYLGVEQVRRPLPPRRAGTRLRVGIAWEASRSGESFHAKSIPLDAFAPLVARTDLELISLQKGPGEQALAASPLRARVADLGSRLVDLRDTADVIAQLDLVLSVDTAVCHLAGAMGVPTWTLLAETSDWRWGLARDDSPWYASMRLFRQASPGDWDGVMAQVLAAIDDALPHVTVPDACFAPRAAMTPDVHLLAALKHTAQGEHLEAAAAYHDALAIDATNGDVWNNFGVVLAKSGRLADSRAAFARAVAAAPSHADAVRNLQAVDAALQGAPRAAAQGDPSRPRIGMDWQVGANSGWGIYGLNFVAHTLRRGEFTPVAFYDADLSAATPMQRVALAGLADARGDAARVLQGGGDCPFPTLHALGNGLVAGPLAAQLRSTRRVGVVFFEDTHLDAEAIARGRGYDRIVAGSTWNAEMLKACGVDQTVLAIQGIDTTVFHPAPRAGWLANRFTVFSGGKLEYRKGQDLVVAAFARFRQRHREALLMVAWHNHWPQSMAEIGTAGHVHDSPAVRDGRLDVAPWLAKYGIPAEAVLDLGLVPNAMMGPMIREADVALFPNRAEGGTNLVAMEALASAVPCILSANTGHLDLTDQDHNIVLTRQDHCSPTPSFRGTDGWGESSVDEIVEALEFAYQHREEAQRRAANAAAVMANASWQHQVDRLYAAIGDLLA